LNFYDIILIRDKPEEIINWDKTLIEHIKSKMGHIDLTKLKQLNAVLIVNTEKEQNLDH